MIPCDWPVSYSACSDSCPEKTSDFEEMAAAYLWNWTGRVYGLCTITVRPCRQNCYPSSWPAAPSQWTPVLVGGAWYNLGCGVCRGDLCSCRGTTSALTLPGPVAAIVEVLVDGEVLPSDAYRVDNGRLLVRTDGSSWPLCQDMTLPTTEPDTWQITYTRGTDVPFGGQVAVGVLACEFAKAAVADPACRLPQRVQSITRQGITVAVLDTFDDVVKGRTGIWLIDSWVASVTAPPTGGAVYSVDVARPKFRTTTWPT